MSRRNPDRGSRRDITDHAELGRRARAAVRAENSGPASARIRIYARASRAVRLARGRGEG